MLEFNSDGFLVPASKIPSNIKELKTYFAVDSPNDVRRKLFQSYMAYMEDFKKLFEVKNLKQWVNGSFVTKKANPGDIDIVNFIDYRMMLAKRSELKDFCSPLSMINYGLDCYFLAEYPDNNPLYSSYMADCAYWINLFDQSKPDHRDKKYPKGFLEIIV